MIGAGPSGSVAAGRLASLGHRVLMVDAESFPREKVCGDGLVMDAVRGLAELGLFGVVKEAGHQLRMLSIFSPSRVEIKVPGEYLTINRRTLDTLLAGRAIGQGAVFARDRVDDLGFRPDGSVEARVAGSEVPLRARFAILATGARLALARKAGLVAPLRPSAVAMRCYLRSSYPLERMVVSYDRSILPGYAWIFPLGNGRFNIGCGMFFRGRPSPPVNLAAAFTTFTNAFPLARRLTAQGEIESPPRGAMLRSGLQGARPLGPGNLLAVGEAIGTTHPFTGEGIAKAMESGELAAETIHTVLAGGNPALLKSYPLRLEKNLGSRFLGFQAAQNWLSKAWLVDFIARRAQKSRFYRESMAGILQQKADPREIFSLRGVWRSLWE